MKNELPSVSPTMEGLREALFGEINAFREGDGNPARARAICALSKNIVDSVRVQIQFQRVALKCGVPLGMKRLTSNG